MALTITVFLSVVLQLIDCSMFLKKFVVCRVFNTYFNLSGKRLFFFFTSFLKNLLTKLFYTAILYIVYKCCEYV